MCQSPLDRSRPEASDNPDKVELVTGLACRHVFHRCCLVECRMHGIGRCPTCQAPLPRGFTPETVREERERHRIRDRIIARSRRATDRPISASESHRQRNDTTARRESDDERWKSDAGNAGDGVFESRHGDGRVRRRGVTSESAENVGARNGETARSHPYASPSPSRSPSSASEDGDDDTVLISMTQ